MDSKQTDKDPSRVPDEPTIKESTWLGLAIALVIITVILFSIAAVWVALAPNSEDMVRRAQTFTPFGAVLFAMVTFCTVAWRGLVTTRQADLQAKQIEQQIRQNDAKDEENLAKLLIDGTKLVTDKDGTEATALAGIAALETVITAPNGRFATQAMDVIGEQIKKGVKQLDSITMVSARRALKRGANIGRISERNLELDCGSNSEPNPEFRWKKVNGFRSLNYIGGQISWDDLVHVNTKELYFEDVKFLYCEVQSFPSFTSCNFYRCNIKSLRTSSIGRCTFVHNDFSDFELSDRLDFTEDDYRMYRLLPLKNNQNYYFGHRPPKPVKGINWDDYFEVREPTGDSDIPF